MSQLNQNKNTIGADGQSGTLNDTKNIEYTREENNIWERLYKKQIENLKSKAVSNFFECLKIYDLPSDRVPQLSEVSNTLKRYSGWEVVRVEELIDSQYFFDLLAHKKFPSTVYIRTLEELDISRDPDIFHELFGHCTMLFDSAHAHYLQVFGEIGSELNESERKLFQRLFWFTYEVGLMQTKSGVRIYGGSILSSLKESLFVTQSRGANIKQFSGLDVMRTPYRADILQSTYYVLNDFSEIANILNDKKSIRKIIEAAYDAGEYPAAFPVNNSRYINYNGCSKILGHNPLSIHHPEGKAEM